MPAEDGSPSGRISRYELHVRLGEGSSGPVYKAWDPELERWVALRLIPPGLAGRGEERQSLIREALTVSSLEHPNIDPVYDIGEAADGSLFLVSALCEGETLAERMTRGTTRPEVAVELAAQIAAAVGRAHEHGILHGRLRPSNVWVGGDGQVRVVDFGLSGLEERTWRTLRIEPQAKEHLAPELRLGESVSPRSDVWAIGSLLASMLGPREGLAEDLSRIVERALSSHPSDRQASAGALRDDLRSLREPSPRPASRGPGRPPELSGVRRLSQYRIGELLGGGGMGVVYRAEDIHLGRTVALKFLPADMASDEAAKARFLQEARAASALDHPNICTVYEIGETEENRLYLAMPCYEGETLKAKISRGPLPVSEALDYALQAAKGLARAHRQGIVHRDVKPANLMVTTDGLVKILDFGVAKLAGEASLTRTGAAVGTAAYMAPEQILGNPVDGRADLWSLGVVLHEMVTGRRPFPGDNSEAVRHAVLNRDPEPLARLRPDAPPELERLVRGLLARDPGDRCPTADAVAAELGRLLGLPPSSQPPASVAARVSRRIRLTWRIAVPALLLVGILSGLPPWARGRFSGKRPSEKAPTVVQLTDRGGLESFPSMSPDGNFFAYAKQDGNDQDIFIQRVGGGNPINLTADSPLDDTHPAYSPDGKSIAFRSEREGGGIFIMGATGESVRRLTDIGYHPAWSPDSRSLAFATESVLDSATRRSRSQIWRVDVATGRRQPLVNGDGVQPTWSPGGRRIAYWTYFGMDKGDAPRHALWTVAAEGGDPKQVLKDEFRKWNPVWSAGGQLYFLSDRSGSMNLWRIPVDEETGEVEGALEPVTVPARSVLPFSLSRDGRRLIYSTEEGRTNVDRQVLDPVSGRPQGPLLPVTRIMRNLSGVSVSPDGQWIVTVSVYPQEDLYLMRADGSSFRQLMDDVYEDRRPQWSPDGKLIHFFSRRNKHYEAWSIRPDGSGLQRVMGQPNGEIYNPLPSPDGRWLACSDGFQGAAMVDLALPPNRRSLRRLVLRGGESHIFVARAWAPDGRSLIGRFFSRKTSEKEGMGLYFLQTQSFEILPEDGEEPTFLGRQQILLYLLDGAIHGMDPTTKRSWLVTAPPPEAVFDSFGVSSDGRTLYAIRSSSEGDLWMLDTSNS